MKKIVMLMIFMIFFAACQGGAQNVAFPGSSEYFSDISQESAFHQASEADNEYIIAPTDYDDYFAVERTFYFKIDEWDKGDYKCSIDDDGTLQIIDKRTNAVSAPIPEKAVHMYRYDNILYLQTLTGIIKYDLDNAVADKIYIGKIAPVNTITYLGDIIPLEGSTSLYVNRDLAYFMRGTSVYRYHIPSGIEEIVYTDNKIINLKPLSNREIRVTRLNPEWEKCVEETGNPESGLPEYERIDYNILEKK